MNAIHSPSVVAVHEKQGEKRNGGKQQVSMGEPRNASVGRNTREMSSQEMEIHLEFKVESRNFSPRSFEIRDLVVLPETREPRSPRLFDSPVLHTGLTREQSKNEEKIFSRRFWPFLGYGAGANSFDRFGVVGKHRVP